MSEENEQPSDLARQPAFVDSVTGARQLNGMLPSAHQSSNLLLASLSQEDFRFLEQSLERVPLETDTVMLKPNAAIERIYFPENGVVSFHEILRDGSRVGVAIIGYEGFTGWPALLGVDQSPHEAIVAIGGGTALSISAAELLRACAQRQALNASLLRYVHCFMSQMGRTIMSNLTDPADKRLARWLLMNHDRIEGERINLTHKQLGVMLGVRRATVTDVVHILEGNGFIRCNRGQIEVRDRAKLMAFAGESYGSAETEYARFIAPFAKSCGPSTEREEFE